MKGIKWGTTILLIILFYGCSKSPQELIIGKWKFDHMELSNPKNRDSEKGDLTLMLAEMKFSSLTFEYFEDGTFVTAMDEGNKSSHGKYWLESDDTYLCSQQDNKNKEERTEILRLSQDTLVLGDAKGGVVLVRVK